MCFDLKRALYITDFIYTDFVNHSYDYRPNWTPLSPVTITYRYSKMENCGAHRGDTHITEPAQGYVYPLFFCSLAEGNIVDII